LPATERIARLFAGKARSYRGFHRGRGDDQGPRSLPMGLQSVALHLVPTVPVGMQSVALQRHEATRFRVPVGAIVKAAGSVPETAAWDRPVLSKNPTRSRANRAIPGCTANSVPTKGKRVRAPSYTVLERRKPRMMSRYDGSNLRRSAERQPPAPPPQEPPRTTRWEPDSGPLGFPLAATRAPFAATALLLALPFVLLCNTSTLASVA